MTQLTPEMLVEKMAKEIANSHKRVLPISIDYTNAKISLRIVLKAIADGEVVYVQKYKLNPKLNPSFSKFLEGK